MKEKPTRESRDESVRFKCSETEKESYEQAGIETDQTMSNWIRRTLNQEVERLRKQADE